MEKRFFWLKLRETFFNETYIKAMRTFKNGDSLVLTYLEMALYSLKSNGVIERGELTPSLADEISIAINEPVPRVKKTIEMLTKARVAELDGDRLYLTEMMKLMGSESTSAERMRRLRSKKSDETGVAPASQCDSAVTSPVTKSVTTEIESEKEKEKEKESETDSEAPLPPAGVTRGCDEVVSQFNSICASLNKVGGMTEPRRKAVQSALNAVGQEKLTELFRKAEASDFLTKRNSTGWKAGFDWLLKPENYTKVLEGNYDNRNSTQAVPAQTDYTNGGLHPNILEMSGDVDPEDYPF